MHRSFFLTGNLFQILATNVYLRFPFDGSHASLRFSLTLTMWDIEKYHG